MKKIITILLMICGAIAFTTSEALSQHKYKDGNGVFINNGLGYRFADHFDLRLTWHNDVYDNNLSKLGLSGTYTDFLTRDKDWGYTLGVGIARLTDNIAVRNKFTPEVETGIFKRMRLSDTIDILPTLQTFASFPEMQHQAYGARLEIPVSIRVFGDKRFIIGVGVELGRTNTADRFNTKGFLGLMRLGFNF